MHFTKSKFYKLDLLSKHKKCSEYLRSIYEKILKQEQEQVESNKIYEKYSAYLLFTWKIILPFP